MESVPLTHAEGVIFLSLFQTYHSMAGPRSGDGGRQGCFPNGDFE